MTSSTDKRKRLEEENKSERMKKLQVQDILNFVFVFFKSATTHQAPYPCGTSEWDRLGSTYNPSVCSLTKYTGCDIIKPSTRGSFWEECECTAGDAR